MVIIHRAPRVVDAEKPGGHSWSVIFKLQESLLIPMDRTDRPLETGSYPHILRSHWTEPIENRHSQNIDRTN
jgi:hypothetical protein